jgi:flagellar biosynthesis anti-sigma factor FlgM
MSVNGLGIGTVNSVQQTNNDSVGVASGAKGTAARQQVSAEDTTSFTSNPQTVQSLGQAALQTFPTRQEKVEALRQAVSGAQYQLDSAKISEALVNADV